MTVAGVVKERRAFPRKHAVFPVQIRQMSQQRAGIIHNSMTHDFSESGIQLSSFYFYPVNSKMIFDIFPSYNMEPILTVGRVVWVEQVPYQEKYKIGIEFSEMNQESRLYLNRLINAIRT